MVDSKAAEIEVTVAERDYIIKQSPGALVSNRGGGTTGAAVWRSSVLLAEWLTQNDNAMFRYRTLDDQSTVLELGSGISGLVPLSLGPKVARVVATDQQYVLKLLQENIEANLHLGKKASKQSHQSNNIDVLPLDWETSDIIAFLRSNDLQHGVDAILACDCIYNYALIKPLVQTCIDFCRARAACNADNHSTAGPERRPTWCVIAQQLRQPDVFKEWLQEFMVAFRVWRVPDSLLNAGLKEGGGYVLHVGILRQDG